MDSEKKLNRPRRWSDDNSSTFFLRKVELKMNKKYPWLYDSVVHQGYLCKFCELLCGHSSSSQEFVTVGINLGTIWLLFYYWTSKLINLLLFPSFPNSHHLCTNFPNYKGPETQIQMGKKITVKYSGVVNFSSQMSYMSTGNAHLLPSY